TAVAWRSRPASARSVRAKYGGRTQIRGRRSGVAAGTDGRGVWSHDEDTSGMLARGARPRAWHRRLVPRTAARGARGTRRRAWRRGSRARDRDLARPLPVDRRRALSGIVV